MYPNGQPLQCNRDYTAPPEHMNEATARIPINRLSEEAGWRFFPDGVKLIPGSCGGSPALYTMPSRIPRAG